MELRDIKTIGEKIKENINKVIVGKSEVIDILTTTIIVGGHALIEDMPGTGKTVLAKAMAKSIGADFKRVQFTPDMLPSDVTGINYYNQKIGEFIFRKGPIFTNILLADEINRTTPRTQSSLLECMEEKQVTIDGVTHILDKPFFVIATENPIEMDGTFVLPEAQLDRFLVKLSMGYPDDEEGMQILKRFIMNDPLHSLEPVCSKEEIIEASKIYQSIYISDDVLRYILNIVKKTHNHSAVTLGVSPRGSLALLKASQAYAAIKGNSYVSPEEIKVLAPYVLSHRIMLRDEIKFAGTTNREIIEELLQEVEVPTETWPKSNKDSLDR